MFENYKATQKDFEAIEEGIKTVWYPKLNFIFSNKGFFKNIVVISYDSSFIYIWTDFSLKGLISRYCNLSDFFAYKIPHNIQLKDDWQLGWMTGSSAKQLKKLLPDQLKSDWEKKPQISGGLLTPFIGLQKKKILKSNPYTTRESFLATIVHEFGHAYWEKHKLWWYSDKKENISFLKAAKNLYEGKKINKKFYFPMEYRIGELFAFCTEYAAAEILWRNHKLNMDKFIKERLKILIKEEQKKNLDSEDSVLAPNRFPHDFVIVFGKIILFNYPKTWPKTLTRI